MKVWDFETIDTADAANESGIFEMDCMNELKVGNDVHLVSMVKSQDPEVQSIWYAQVSPVFELRPLEGAQQFFLWCLVRHVRGHFLQGKFKFV